jgi:hypothetical protein
MQSMEEEKITQPDYKKGPSWIRRAAVTTFGLRRFSEPRAHDPVYGGEYDSRSNFHVPEIGVEPPLSINPSGGAAARAAAAAQNEMFETSRALKLRDSTRLGEPHVTNDSESGIGIDIRDKYEDGDGTRLMTRKGTF